MAPKVDDSPKEKKGKWRLSNLLHPKDSDRRSSPEAKTNNQPPADTTAETINSDSAYGSSPRNSSSNIPTISDSQAKAQDAEIQTRTDEATGKTITTTTTTTTTTVTTTTGDHYQVPAGQEVVVKQTNQNDNPVELSARPLSEDSSSAVANHNSHQKDNRRRSQSPHDTHPVSAIDPHFPQGGFLGPQDLLASSPTQRQNFSYPARTPPGSQHQVPQQNGNGTQQHYQAYNPPAPQSGYYDRPRPTSGPIHPHERPGYGYGPHSPGVHPDPLRPGVSPERPSTVQSLKTAAAGIHGAGETLRGTINSAMARRTGAPSEVVAAHDSVAAKGRQEIETGRFYKPSSASNLTPQPAYRNSAGQPVPLPPEQYGQGGDAGYNRLQPTTSNTKRYSAEHSANGVLSQVGGGQPGATYIGGSAAVGQEARKGSPPNGKKKGGLRNVLRKSGERLKT